MMGDRVTATAYGGSLFPQNSSDGEELPRSDHAVAELEEKPALAVVTSDSEVAIASNEVGEALEAQIAAGVPEEAEYEVAATSGSDCLKSDLVESCPLSQEYEPTESAACTEPSGDASAADRHLITPAWEQLKQLRAAEGYVQEIDAQIQDLNSKLGSAQAR